MADPAQIKLITLNSSGVHNPDDPTFPYKLRVSLRPPELTSFAFLSLYGSSEEIVVRAMTLPALEEFIAKNDFRRHPRLTRLIITGPEGEVEKLER